MIRKITFISIYLIFFFVGDAFFSNFIYKKDIEHNCYKYLDNYYFFKKNCYAKEKWVKGVTSYDVYTDENGFRFSGEKTNYNEATKTAVFFGDSFTYGMGLDYEKTFVGLLENKQKEFKILNLGVPGYSPTVFKYQLENLIESNIVPKKIFFVLDISDVSEEASQWSINTEYKHPVQLKKSVKENKSETKDENFKKFIKKNFKGSRLIARSINNFFRYIRLYFKNVNEKEKKPGHSTWGNFLYTNLKDTDQNLWEPFGFYTGIKKIEKNAKAISLISRSINADLYVVIYPWPDTLEYGQSIFHWEKFSENLCNEISCKKLINFFPDFKNERDTSNDWLTKLYINGDLHITEYGHTIIADKLLKELF